MYTILIAVFEGLHLHPISVIFLQKTFKLKNVDLQEKPYILYFLQEVGVCFKKTLAFKENIITLQPYGFFPIYVTVSMEYNVTDYVCDISRNYRKVKYVCFHSSMFLFWSILKEVIQ